MTENVVECLACSTPFDAVEDTRRHQACPHCDATWTELHKLADPDENDPEDVEIDYPFDGPGGVVG